MYARLFELDDRHGAYLRQHETCSDNHCQPQCHDRLRNPVHANASTVQAAETAEAEDSNHGHILFRGFVSKKRIGFDAQVLTLARRVCFASVYRAILTNEFSRTDPSCKCAPLAAQSKLIQASQRG